MATDQRRERWRLDLVGCGGATSPGIITEGGILATKKNNGNGKLTPEQFTLLAIERLRKNGYKGIHTVYSGFNDAFRSYFGSDPVAATQALAKAGNIVSRPVKRGAMLYKPDEAPAEKANGQNALAKMGI